MSHDAKREAFERVSGEVHVARGGGARAARGDRRASARRSSQAELALRESELRLAHLDESIREKWGVEIATWEPPVADAADAPAPSRRRRRSRSEREREPAPRTRRRRAATPRARRARTRCSRARPRPSAASELDEVRKKLSALGDVNLGAIEEHEELKERFRFLSDQKRDLESTLTSLRDAIARINRTSRRASARRSRR